MELIEFKSIDRTNRTDMNGNWWSRIYEYPLVLDLLEKYGANDESVIHNTCWGYENMHIWFKNILDNKYKHNINSDILASKEPNTYVYNLINDPKPEWVESFDFVINVSTLEEVRHDHVDVFMKSFSMVKSGGYFICTFDLPGLQIDKFEKLFNKKYEVTPNPISGANSELINNKYSHLRCGYMVVKK